MAGEVEIARSPREVAEAPGVAALVTMLPETRHLRDVYEGVGVQKNLE